MANEMKKAAAGIARDIMLYYARSPGIPIDDAMAGTTAVIEKGMRAFIEKRDAKLKHERGRNGKRS